VNDFSKAKSKTIIRNKLSTFIKKKLDSFVHYFKSYNTTHIGHAMFDVTIVQVFFAFTFKMIEVKLLNQGFHYIMMLKSSMSVFGIELVNNILKANSI